MKKRDWGTAALLCIGLGFALLGQYYFVYRRDPFFRDGIVFYSLAAAAFGVLWWRLRRPEKEVPPEPAAPKVWAERIPLRRVAAVGGLILAAFAGWTAARRPWDSDFSGVFWLWVVGVGWFLASFAPSIPKDWPQRCVGWLKRNRGEVWRVAALLAVALAVRGVALEEVPRNFGGDEGIQALAGLRLVERPLDNPFGTGWYSVPTMSFLLVGTAMRIFGATVAGARTLSAFAGMGAVLSTYLLARELWGRRVGTFAALLLAFGHYHLHFSRLASNQIGDALFITLALWLLVRGLASEEPWYFVLAGAVTGAAWYAYFGARLVLIVIGCYLGLRALKERGFLHRHWESLALMGLAAFVVVLPLLFHYLRDWGAMAARYNQVSIFSSGWLAQEQIVTGRSAVYLLLQQLWKAVSAFHYTVDPTFWYRPDIPLLDFVSGVFMLFGLVDVVRCRRWRSDGLLLLWFGLALVLGWTLNENPPSSQRLTITAPAVAIFAALGLDGLGQFARKLVGGSRAVWTLVAAGVLGAVAALNLGFYFFDYAPTRVYGNPTAEISDVLCDVLETRADVPPVYFDGAPYMYWDFGATAFRLRHLEGRDIAPGQETEPISVEEGALFVVLELKMDDFGWLLTHYPGGVTEHYTSDEDGRLLFVLYEVPSWRE